MVKTDLLQTPFYRTIPEFNENSYPAEPEYNYNSYDLFCLKTKLVPFVQDLFPDIPGVYVTFLAKRIHNRMVQIAQISNGNDVVKLSDLPDVIVTEIQTFIDKEISNRSKICLILRLSDIKTLPSDWSISISPGLILPDDIQASLEIVNGDVYFYAKIDKLGNKNIDFSIYINQLQDDISYQLHQMYKEGYIVGADAIAEKWNLDNVIPGDDMLSIYKPTWTDNRFAPNMIEFLRRRIADPYGYIKVNIGTNKVIRHIVASKLSEHNSELEVIFNGDYIMVKVNDLTKARKIVKEIDIGKQLSRKINAAALTIDAPSFQRANDYYDKLTNYLITYPEVNINGRPNEILLYFTSNTSLPYTVSTLTPISTNVENILKDLM